MNVETISMDNGKYLVNMQSKANGQLLFKSFVAESYSEDGDCDCTYCDDAGNPQWSGFERVTLGSKCWCVVCSDPIDVDDPCDCPDCPPC